MEQVFQGAFKDTSGRVSVNCEHVFVADRSETMVCCEKWRAWRCGAFKKYAFALKTITFL